MTDRDRPLRSSEATEIDAWSRRVFEAFSGGPAAKEGRVRPCVSAEQLSRRRRFSPPPSGEGDRAKRGGGGCRRTERLCVRVDHSKRGVQILENQARR